MRTLVRLVAIAVAALVTSAHVGDTNTHFRGSAGPYPIQVVVRHPGVVPGLADITVRVEGNGVGEVTVQLVPASTGLDGAPRPDVAEPVPGEPGLYSAELWFMTSGTYSVHVAVDGTAGSGTAIVPVVSVATRRLALGGGLAVVLVLLGLLLAAGLVSIVRAAVGESVLAPGELPDRSRRIRARVASGVALAVLALVLTGGRAWWGAEDGAYRASMFEPLAIESAVDRTAGELRIALVDPDWLERRWSPIVADHGKMMHAFLVRIPDQTAFAHVHPVAAGTDSFRLALPPLPPGEYALYADVVHETGFAQTLTDTVAIAPTTGRPTGDPDDAWWTAAPPPADAGSGTAVVRFADGSTLELEGDATGRITAGQDLTLRFAARDANGEPTALEPYMGMAAHVAVRRDDGSVFVHLHPSGSVAPASQRQVALSEAPLVVMAEARSSTGIEPDTPAPRVDTSRIDTSGTGPDSAPRPVVSVMDGVPDSVAEVAAEPATPLEVDTAGAVVDSGAVVPDSGHAALADPSSDTDSARDSVPVHPMQTAPPLDPVGLVRVPYTFPAPGRYRLFVQTRRAGVVRTAAFDVDVAPGPR